MMDETESECGTMAAKDQVKRERWQRVRVRSAATGARFSIVAGWSGTSGFG